MWNKAQGLLNGLKCDGNGEFNPSLTNQKCGTLLGDLGVTLGFDCEIPLFLTGLNLMLFLNRTSPILDCQCHFCLTTYSASFQQWFTVYESSHDLRYGWTGMAFWPWYWLSEHIELFYLAYHRNKERKSIRSVAMIFHQFLLVCHRALTMSRNMKSATRSTDFLSPLLSTSSWWAPSFRIFL
jgi:hypothetical protein